ncbi:MAG TPA: hypothetical protein VD966_02875 [Pyrinomonadaceae bacterium]|nr:hypothetical protein [Pyrinomonadaceae bacterium]
MITALVLGLACQPDETNTNSRPARNSSKASSGITNQKFLSSLPSGFKLPEQSDEVGMRVLSDYGAMFVARGGAVPPPAVIFENEAAVNEWQSSVKTTRAEMGGISVELQAPAMTALMEARDEARQDNLSITPRGSDAARRSYANTVKLWQSRVNSGLAHWTEEGSLTKDEAARIRALSPQEQIPEILRLEEEGLYFSTDFSKSILYSVAAPGTSQHLSMLAFDVKEYDNANVRSILASHGWFQTITSDLPHFTFLGVTEDELPSLGLKKVTNSGRTFWVPDLN